MNSKTSQSDSISPNNAAIDYWRLFKDIPEPYLLFEATEPYTVIDINKARAQFSGLAVQDYIGRSLFDVYPYTDEHFRNNSGKDLREHLQQLVRTGRSYQIKPWSQTVVGSNGVRRKMYFQGTYFPIRDADGGICHILAHARDVSEELHAIERATTAESRLNAALTIGKVGSWVFDPETNRIHGDDNFIRLFNITNQVADSFSLDGYLQSVHEDDRTRIRAAVRRSIKKLVPFEEEYRAILHDGTQRWVLARGRAEMRDGHVTFPGVVVDITGQRTLEAQVKQAHQQDALNRQATRMLQQRNEELEAISRTKDEFVALASHQLRTPATAVKQYIGMMLQGYVGDVSEDQIDVLTKAFESNERQIQIINQILSAARADTGRLVMTPVPVDLRAMVQGITADMEGALRQRQHTLVVHVPKNEVMVAADLGYLRMAIENVLHNAVVYTPTGGSITITLKRVGLNCVLSIADTGVGIRKADLSKLFVKFSRIHNPLSVEAGGSGIGLYLTAEIVRLHAGSVTVTSRMRNGTIFAISLPLMQNNKSARLQSSERG